MVKVMSQDVPPAVATSPSPKRRGRWLLYGCGGLLALMLLVIATVAITIWWIQRPIKPVVLSPKEKAVAEQKLRLVEEPKVPPPSPTLPRSTTPPTTRSLDQATGGELPGWVFAGPTNQGEDRTYVPGAKAVRITEREINGLLNANTDLGNTVRLEFARDAINAYLAVPIPKDFPMLGGHMFRARGRFRISIGNGQIPYAILEDVTVFGVSLPKAWLGGVKGENLLADAMGRTNGAPVLRGVKSLRVEPGALVFELED